MLRPDLPRVVTLADARAAGLTDETVRHALRTGWWRRVHHGVYLTRPEDPGRADALLAALALAGPRAAVSGWDAGRVVGLGPLDPPRVRPLVLDRAGANRVVAGVLVRPTDRPYRTSLLPWAHPTLPLVPVVEPHRAVADLAVQLRDARAVRALVTSAVQRGRCTPAGLLHELDGGPRNGSRFFRAALEDVLDGARSVAEAEANDLLRAARVPPYELNVPVVGQDGALIGYADVLWRALRAVLEVDGRRYHAYGESWERTLERHNALGRLELAIEHHPPSTIRRGGARWAEGVAGWLRGRAAALGVPYVPGSGPLRAGTDGPVPFVVAHLP